jgi:hypothetical protein
MQELASVRTTAGLESMSGCWMQLPHGESQTDAPQLLHSVLSRCATESENYREQHALHGAIRRKSLKAQRLNQRNGLRKCQVSEVRHRHSGALVRLAAFDDSVDDGYQSVEFLLGLELRYS